MIPAIKIGNLAIEKAELTILKTLCYFDIFNYPLTEEEIFNFMGLRTGKIEFSVALRQLHQSAFVFKMDQYYSLHNDPAMVKSRKMGNSRALKLIPKAARIGSFINKFPFVRGVAVSGSLSKDYADDRADIDFFIVTAANRLWIARTLLHLFKKLTFLVGRQHFYCMNYFVDETALLITDQNLYTATEVVTLFPVAGLETIDRFFHANNWTREWLPAYNTSREINTFDHSSTLKRWLESIPGEKKADQFDDFLFRLTNKRWSKKKAEGQKNMKGKIMNLVTGKHFCKSDPEAFQDKIVALYEFKIIQLRNRWPQYFD